MDFETSGVSKQEMTLIVDYLSSSVSDYKEYVLIDRRQREIILSEAQFSNSGCADESCAIEIGQLLSANEMILGSLGSVGSLYLMNIKLIDVTTGKTLNDVSEKYPSIEELITDCENLITELFYKKKTSLSVPSDEIDDPIEMTPTNTNGNKDIKDNNIILGLSVGTYYISIGMTDYYNISEVNTITTYYAGAICLGLNTTITFNLFGNSYIGIDYSFIPFFIDFVSFSYDPSILNPYEDFPIHKIGIEFISTINEEWDWGCGLSMIYYSLLDIGINGLIAYNDISLKIGITIGNGFIPSGGCIEIGYQFKL